MNKRDVVGTIFIIVGIVVSVAFGNKEEVPFQDRLSARESQRERAERERAERERAQRERESRERERERDRERKSETVSPLRKSTPRTIF